MQDLTAALATHFDGDGFTITDALGELTLTAPAAQLRATMRLLRDHENFCFVQLLDLAGVDYSEHPGYADKKFAAVYHLLSLRHNWRLRVRVFCQDEDLPQLPSITDLWPSADWFEREAFDLYGIVFHGHKDLRRLLTDYGFVGHPFRKDFPISGHVEMRYDPERQRVVYVPVSIPPRDVTPRITREDAFGQGRDDHG